MTPKSLSLLSFLPTHCRCVCCNCKLQGLERHREPPPLPCWRRCSSFTALEDRPALATQTLESTRTPMTPLSAHANLSLCSKVWYSWVRKVQGSVTHDAFFSRCLRANHDARVHTSGGVLHFRRTSNAVD